MRILLSLYEHMHAQGMLAFNLALQLFTEAHSGQQRPSGSLECSDMALSTASVLAMELDAHNAEVSELVRRMRSIGQEVFLPRIGTMISVVVERGYYEPLLDWWARTVQSLMSPGSRCHELVWSVTMLARNIIQSAILFLTETFAHLYMTNLRGTWQPAKGDFLTPSVSFRWAAFILLSCLLFPLQRAALTVARNGIASTPNVGGRSTPRNNC